MSSKSRYVFAGMLAAAMVVIVPTISASSQMVITVQPVHQHSAAPERLQAGDVMVTQGNTTVPVTRLQRLAGDLAQMQLFILLDDSTRSSSLGLQLPELKKFINSLPGTTEVGVGYMRNGTFALAHEFTADHEKAAGSLRLPSAIPGENGSPYFVLSDLAKHWPSKEATGRRAVLVFTDGIDRYYDNQVIDDPYVEAAVQDALKNNVAVYSIYLRGAGFYGRSTWVTNFAQGRLLEVSQETGGYAYFQDFSDPVSIRPFLDDFESRLANQYKLTFEALNQRGLQRVKLRTELPGLKLEGPSRVYVQ